MLLFLKGNEEVTIDLADFVGERSLDTFRGSWRLKKLVYSGPCFNDSVLLLGRRDRFASNK